MALNADVAGLLGAVSNVYYPNMPADIDNAVCIYATGGYERSASGTEVEEPTFQIKVRNTVYATGIALCDTIKDILHGYVGGKFLAIYQQGDVIDIGRDTNNRQEWTINFRCYYRR